MLSSTLSFPTFQIFEEDSRPYGKTYTEWTRLWWEWLASFPSKDNPALDTSGSLCRLATE